MILLETNKALYITTCRVMVIHPGIRIDFSGDPYYDFDLFDVSDHTYIETNHVWKESLKTLCSIYDMHMDYTKYWRRYVGL